MWLIVWVEEFSEVCEFIVKITSQKSCLVFSVDRGLPKFFLQFNHIDHKPEIHIKFYQRSNEIFFPLT